MKLAYEKNLLGKERKMIKKNRKKGTKVHKFFMERKKWYFCLDSISITYAQSWGGKQSRGEKKIENKNLVEEKKE